MKLEKIAVKISVAWWIKYYIAGAAFTAQMTGRKPNLDRVNYWVRKAIVIKHIK